MEKTAIIILGGGMIKNPDGAWRTTNYEEGDNFGALGDRTRVLAAGYLYKDNPGLTVFALGGKGQMAKIKGIPAVSEVMAKELKQMGIPEKDVITERDSGNTFEQLKALKDIVIKYGLRKVFIVSNRYHLPRVEVMLEKLNDLKDIFNFCSVELMNAENIVTEHEPERKAEIESAYKSKTMQDRLALEKKGIEDINNRRYKIK